ncbi:PAS domain S-box protein [Flavobacterium silvaticum]|uniref:histidine kinase n=1 Tax=Flavobacterium silvaticum TaxID=1852020 RepID=A0A972FTX3_9FLAO|nr:PAS domain S-box protein [Flavobacterium silvaticum]NMH29254.1 PAS domain S-box protein [Flavobacterium silvaticum]
MEYTTTGLHVLIIEGNPASDALKGQNMSDYFDESGYHRATSVSQAKDFVDSGNPAHVILVNLDGKDSGIIEEMTNLSSVAPLIAILSFEDKKLAALAVERGFSDYIFIEDLTPGLLQKSIAFSIEKYKLHRPNEAEDFRNLFQTSPMPKFIYEVETLSFLEVNNAAIETYGYSREEFMELTLLDIRTPDEIPHFMQALKDNIEKPVGIANVRHKTKSGKIIDVEVQGNPVEFNGKNARAVIVIDITEKRRIEKAILASEGRFKTLVHAGGDLIGVLNPDGKLSYTSPNHLAIMGWTDEDLKRHSLETLIHPDDQEEVATFFKLLPQQSSLYSKPYRIKRADGNYIWIETIATNALDDSSVNGFVLNSRDITARVQNEEHIAQMSERFTALSNATSDAIYDYDYASNRISFAGSGYHSLIGHKLRNNSADYSFFESGLHPDDQERVIRFMDKATHSQKKNHYELEYRFLKKDGTYANILDRFEILRNNTRAVRKVGAMQDISARKFQETILNFEKDIYQANANPKIGFEGAIEKMIRSLCKLITHAYCGILTLEENGTVGFMSGNDHVEQFSKSILGKKASENPHPLSNVLSSGKKVIIQDFESDARWKDFSEFARKNNTQSLWSFPVRKSSGKIIGSINALFKNTRIPQSQEITLIERAANLLGVLFDSRLAHIETDRAKERYDIVAKATSDTIWDWNIKDDKFEWNKGIRGVFGYKRNEVGDTSSWWFDRIHPEDSIRMSVKLYSFLEQKTEKWQDEYRFATADGSYKYVYDRAFLVKDANGKAIRMIGAMQDITRQKAEEQRLKLLETVITQMKDAVIITEAGRNSDSIPKILFVNPAFTAMTGYSAQEVMGKSPTVFLNRKSIHSHFRKLMQMLKNRQEFRFETLNLKKNGEDYWMNISMVPITNKEGHHSHWISILRDITDEKRQEREKEQLIRELTQNNKDLKQFSYITSHNLRAPLSNLTGLINLIEDIPVDNPELRDILNGFHKSTHLLNETINDLVKVVIIKDNPSIHKEEVLIKDVFENVFSQLNFMISMYKPVIKLQLERVSILNINKAYLESILLNLLTNAIKYRSSDRKLRIFISSKIVNDSIQLVFRDNGIGIDLERNRDKIFGLYQRFHNYPDSKGLGLYLVKSQVESMGGQIAVESAVDKGTTFTITFKKQT